MCSSGPSSRSYFRTVLGPSAGRGPAEDRLLAADPAGPRDRQVVLTQVQHVRAGGQRDVGPVVDREQGVVAGAGVREHLQCGELGLRLERTVAALVAQLHDVHAAGQRGVEELGEVPALGAGVGAQVEAGGVESSSQ